MKAVILDCDDVLLDWVGGFRTFASDHLGRVIEGEPQSWNMGSWIGTSDAVALELVRAFNASEGFGDLRAVWGARLAIDKLAADPNVRLHVVTSCSSDRLTVAMRRRNLEREFGHVFDSIHCLDLGESKKKILQAFAQGSVWVEDNYHNALLGLEVGHTVLIRERPHNREFRAIIEPRVTWFTNWHEVGEI